MLWAEKMNRTHMINRIAFHIKDLLEKQIEFKRFEADAYAHDLRDKLKKEVSKKWFWSKRRKEEYVEEKAAKYINSKFEKVFLEIRKIRSMIHTSATKLEKFSDEVLQREYYLIFGEEDKWINEGF